MKLKIIITIIFIFVAGFLILTGQSEIDISRFLNHKLLDFGVYPKLPSPSFDYKIASTPVTYKEGLEVYGLKWQEDYKELLFIASNQSSKVPLENLVLELSFPANIGIVKFDILSQQNIQELRLSQDSLLGGGIQRKGQIDELITTFTNYIKISALKVAPRSQFQIRFILKITTMQPDIGFISAEYNYSKQGKVVDFKSENQLEVDAGVLKINREKNKRPKFRTIALIPSKPLIFKKNGHIVSEGQ